MAPFNCLLSLSIAVVMIINLVCQCFVGSLVVTEFVLLFQPEILKAAIQLHILLGLVTLVAVDSSYLQVIEVLVLDGSCPIVAWLFGCKN